MPIIFKILEPQNCEMFGQDSHVRKVSTYTAKFVEVSKEYFRLCEHDVSFNLNFFERLHVHLQKKAGNINRLQKKM